MSVVVECIYGVECLLALHAADEALGRLETGKVMSGNGDGGVLRYVASCLLGTVLHDETTETAEVDVLLIYHAVSHYVHKSFYGSHYFAFGDASLFRNDVDDVCFSHNNENKLGVIHL